MSDRLEYLREQIRNECISYGEVAELQGLADTIDPGDVELLEWAGVPEQHPSSSDEEFIVDIPGQLLATYKDGAITGFVFMPAASNAGYFGPAARMWTGDEAALDVESVDGPFWRAVQERLANDELVPEELAGSHFACEWQE